MLSQLRGMIQSRRFCENRLESNARLHLHNRVVVVILLLFALACKCRCRSARARPAALLKPATDTWPTYNGDYSGGRFSTLDQINAGNVGSLTLAWVFQPHASTIKSTPWK